MKSKIIIFVFILSLLPLFVFADDNKLEGSITLTGKINNISGNEAKFNEYRDIPAIKSQREEEASKW